MQDRIAALMSRVPEGIDAVLITSPVNRRYYTGFPSSAGALVALRDKSYFIIDSRYYEAACATIKGCEMLLQKKLNGQIKEILDRHGVKTLGIEGDSVTLTAYSRFRAAFPGVEIPMDGAVSDVITKQRMLKTEGEIQRMARAQRIAEQTFDHIRGVIRPGMTERDISLEMEMFSRKNGSEENSFSFIIASGPNGSMPHAVPGDRRVQKGDLITMDFGCTVEGYRSDMTRTVALGDVGERQRAVYELVLRAQLSALEAIKPGAVCKDVDKVARDLIDGSPYKGMFGHGLGHALGLEVHENPRFNPEDTTVLEPGHVLSVEPGIYIPGEFGVRIEDVVVVTETGHRNLMTSPKELICLAG